ncbi:MAG: class I SAM-dependent methyltransferase [Ectothiorhodospiraceae bacterium]|nr:class I SAM-dependent methyltransferase [Chromatiales bacterium]MCP5157070.1 class I SAM-dependent methyltransferase [Ectothiorhodospiraceae bacterium]
MDRYRAANRDLWEAWTPHNLTSPLYDVEGFVAGRETLCPVELAGVGQVAGRRLLHLQCHFGLGTLSWVRHGAIATGVDFAPSAIAAARELSERTGLPATFVESDLYALPEHLEGEFDVVFTSHGVLGWLPDLEGWARVIAHYLAPGGLLFLAEAHPVAMLFDETRDDRELRLRYPYFHRDEPFVLPVKGSYAAPEAEVSGTEHFWIHPVSDILGALLRAGLRIESFDEHPFMAWSHFPWMVQRPDGHWEMPPDAPELPLMLSLRARAP